MDTDIPKSALSALKALSVPAVIRGFLLPDLRGFVFNLAL
jgi:hypothetical protein